MDSRADVPQMLLRLTQGAEPAFWLIFLLALAIWTCQRVTGLAWSSGRRSLAAIVVTGLCLRVLVPFGPTNWYFGLANTDLGRQFYTRSTTYLPLPNRLVIFDWGGGSRAIAALNLTLGCATIAYLWYAAIRANHGPRVCSIFAGLVAITPMYVRYSASDSTQTILLFLYACAAAAFTDLANGHRGVPAYAVLVSSVVLAFPVRAESSFLFLGIPLLLLNSAPRIARIAELIRHRGPLIALLLGCGLGIPELIGFQLESIRSHGHLSIASVAIAVVARTLFLVSPMPISFFPVVLAIPIWTLVGGLVRRRAWQELATIYVPVWFSSIPFLFGAGIFSDLASAGYNLISVLFILLACARGIDALWTKFEHREFLAEPWKRCAVLSSALPLVFASFVLPWRRTYAYQEEFRFLRDALPGGEATVLTIWDPDADAGDFDCCLAMPYPTLWIEHPALHWTVLKKEDLSPERIRDLRFDYYYPGSMTSIDLDSLDSWYGRLVVESDLNREKQKRHLTALKELDERIRHEHAVVPFKSATVDAHTFSGVAFRNDHLRLSLYASEQPASP